MPTVRDRVRDMARATRKACVRLRAADRKSYASGIWQVAVRMHPEFQPHKDTFFAEVLS